MASVPLSEYCRVVSDVIVKNIDSLDDDGFQCNMGRMTDDEYKLFIDDIRDRVPKWDVQISPGIIPNHKSLKAYPK
jgi:hypothetical protein